MGTRVPTGPSQHQPSCLWPLSGSTIILLAQAQGTCIRPHCVACGILSSPNGD